jgi:hypothetical protein
MFKLSTSDRLNRWKAFRRQLNNITLLEALVETQEFWNQCPFYPHYLDVSEPSSWPDPWQLITENYYCDLAKSLGIIYTLYLTTHKDYLFPELRVYFDPDNLYYYHIAYMCHGKYVLNLVQNEIVNKQHINQELKLKYCYTAIDLKLEQY